MTRDIKGLIKRMTVSEKASFVSGADFWHTKKIERLGIPDMMVSDGPCGLRKQEEVSDSLGISGSKKSVSYPSGSCIACSFDRELLRKCGEILGEEASAEGIGILLGPAVNIKRSPLCGRNFEYFSEDPYLSGELAKAYIDGVQSKGVGTSIKHFAANSQEYRRMTDSSDADERTLREIYFPAFEKAVKESHPWSVMCSYNRINGEYSSENEWLLSKVLRDEWDFDGLTVSDWGAVNDRPKGVSAGLDLEMPGPGKYTTQDILDALKNGSLEEEKLDRACENILKTVFRYYDNRREGLKYDIEEHRRFAEKAADESVVLLKNRESVLPLSKNERIAFIGQFAKIPRFQGGGSSKVNSYKPVSALEAAEGIDIVYSDGYSLNEDDSKEDVLEDAVRAAESAGYAVLFVGTTEETESEGFDRKDISLPENQVRLIEAVSAVQKNTVIVVHAGSCVEMPWIDKVSGIVYAYMGGEAIGNSIVKVLFGDVNPSGKLAETFPLKLEDNPSFIWYHGENDHTQYREGVFVGYRWYDKIKREVLFPFGFGLSYTDFDYYDIKADKDEMNENDCLKVSCKIKNTGKYPGKEVVQLYVRNPSDRVIRPVRELRGFEKIYLDPDEEKTVCFYLDKRAFAFYSTENSMWSVEEGEYCIEIGKSSREILLNKSVILHSNNSRKKVFTENSILGDVLANKKGAEVISDIFLGVLRSIETEDTGSSIMANTDALIAMMSDFPLRNLPMMAGDLVTPEMIKELLRKINE